MYYDEQSNSIDELGSMRLKDTQLANYKRYENQKRKEPFEDARDPKKQAYETVVFDKESQSSHDQINAYARLMI